MPSTKSEARSDSKMSAQIQTIIALAIVAIAAGLLVRGALKKKKHHGCCCPANELKAKFGKR